MHGEIVRINSGKNRVGLDIPEGIYKAINLKAGYSSYLSIDIYNTEGVLEDYIRTDGDEIEIEIEKWILYKIILSIWVEKLCTYL